MNPLTVAATHSNCIIKKEQETCLEKIRRAAALNPFNDSSPGICMKRNKGDVLTVCLTITCSLNENENLKEMKSQQDSGPDSFTLEKEVN
ncbi:hypothetical protein BTVI_67634 [Pitangus sulphuratus]|nr:hypothetical protein BTVI_67634 [Pitangus sulphuratus]